MYITEYATSVCSQEDSVVIVHATSANNIVIDVEDVNETVTNDNTGNKSAVDKNTPVSLVLEPSARPTSAVGVIGTIARVLASELAPPSVNLDPPRVNRDPPAASSGPLVANSGPAVSLDPTVNRGPPAVNWYPMPLVPAPTVFSPGPPPVVSPDHPPARHPDLEFGVQSAVRPRFRFCAFVCSVLKKLLVFRSFQIS